MEIPVIVVKLDVLKLTSVAHHWKNNGLKLTGKSQILPKILSNIDDEMGKKWKKEFLENFGYGLANVIDILDPDVIGVCLVEDFQILIF